MGLVIDRSRLRDALPWNEEYWQGYVDSQWLRETLADVKHEGGEYIASWDTGRRLYRVLTTRFRPHDDGAFEVSNTTAGTVLATMLSDPEAKVSDGWRALRTTTQQEIAR